MLTVSSDEPLTCDRAREHADEDSKLTIRVDMYLIDILNGHAGRGFATLVSDITDDPDDDWLDDWSFRRISSTEGSGIDGTLLTLEFELQLIKDDDNQE